MSSQLHGEGDEPQNCWFFPMIAVFMASLAHYLLVPACGPVIDGASDVQAPLTISLYAPIYRPRQQHVRANTLCIHV